MSDQTFQRVAAVTALVGVAFAIASGVLGLAAAPGASDPAASFPSVITRGSTAGTLFRLSMVADVLGYYLPLIPLAILLWRWLHPRSPLLSALCTVGAIGYCLLGAAGAAVLGQVLPSLADQYPAASAAQRELLLTVGGAVTTAVYNGIWNTVDAIDGGVWWLGTGYLLRSVRPKLGTLWMVTGAASLVDALGFMTGAGAVGLAGLIPFLVLAPVSAGALALDLLRRPVQLSIRD